MHFSNKFHMGDREKKSLGQKMKKKNEKKCAKLIHFKQNPIMSYAKNQQFFK